jgi:hypothetical protein
MAIKYVIVLFVETPRKFITPKLSIRKPGSSSVLIICDLFNSHALFIYKRRIARKNCEKSEKELEELKRILRIARKPSKINLLWLNILGLTTIV